MKCSKFYCYHWHFWIHNCFPFHRIPVAFHYLNVVMRFWFPIKHSSDSFSYILKFLLWLFARWWCLCNNVFYFTKTWSFVLPRDALFYHVMSHIYVPKTKNNFNLLNYLLYIMYHIIQLTYNTRYITNVTVNPLK